MNKEDLDLVSEEDACPKCGEREVDRLAWIDDQTVECQECGEQYTPDWRECRG